MSLPFERRLDQICDTLYEAAAITDTWPKALSQLAWAFGAASGHFVFWDKRAKRAEFAVTARGDSVSETNYAARYGSIDPIRQLLEHQVEGCWVTNHRYRTDDFLRQDPYHNEFLRALGYRFTTKCCVYEDHATSSYGVFGFARGPAAEPFEQSLVEELASVLNPHLARAAMLHRKLAPTRVRGRLIEAALDLLPIGIVITTPERKVLTLNRAAVDMVEEDRGIRVRNDILAIDDADKNRALAAMCQCTRKIGWIQVTSGPRQPLTVSVSPLPAAVDLRSQRGDRAALVLIADPARSPSRDLQEALQSLFGLSSAEARIAFLIARGETVANAAALQHVTEATARAQLKAVFAKMSLSRQSELVATVLKLASTHSNGDTASSN